MNRRRRIPALAVALLATASPLRAATPAPLDPVRFAFPGDVTGAASAVSAGCALADRWLGDDPAVNPAARPARGATLAPQGLRVSRQDISSRNRDFSQTFGYVDLAAASLSLPAGPVALTLYATQPALRLENTTFTLGTAADTGPGARLRTDGSARELRGGLALAIGRGASRAGLALEWTHRDDRYQLEQSAGSPDDGVLDVSFGGDAFGGAAGVRLARAPERRGGFVLGAAVHAVGALDVTGTATADLLSGRSARAVRATRASTWDGGASLRITLSPETGLFAGAGARGPQSWDAFGVEARSGTLWALGFDYHDAETPWTARFGAGQEVQPGAPEPRAGLLSAGGSYVAGSLVYDLGITHRTIRRAGRPAESDDRLVAALRVAF
jgi:hypothetical protein